MTKQQKITEVKDLLNQVLVLCDKNQDDFLLEVSETVQNLLKEKDETEKEDYYDSDGYYDSSANC